MGQGTRIDVAILPGQRFDPAASVCVIVDVLRASSSIVTLLDRGCGAVVAAADTTEARRLHKSLPDHLLCGEEHGLPPEGFAYGNSPSEFSRLELAGKSVILATSNGTRVLAALAAESPAVLVGCLLNRIAVARAAIEIAQERRLGITVVCSAAYGGAVFVLEDALGAGAIADAALSLDPSLEATDAARFARDAFSVAATDITAAVRSAYHAQELVDTGLGEDVAYCAQLDTSAVAPILQRGEDGVLRLSAR
ncbi:MAG: 2-phosphosulfolactate phosphatase [Dehalococcoidia bacterium]